MTAKTLFVSSTLLLDMQGAREAPSPRNTAPRFARTFRAWRALTGQTGLGDGDNA
jgi:hypothetical protein